MKQINYKDAYENAINKLQELKGEDKEWVKK
jgi:hypothetical protein